jgi:hypothetical protein
MHFKFGFPLVKCFEAWSFDFASHTKRNVHNIQKHFLLMGLSSKMAWNRIRIRRIFYCQLRSHKGQTI